VHSRGIRPARRAAIDESASTVQGLRADEGVVLTSFMSSGGISKSKISAFDLIRFGDTDLGMITKP
jgi:hypothetical protein